MPPRTFGPLSTTRYTVSGVAFDTVRVPPGRFVDGEGAEKRALLVSRPFELGMTLVTQVLWRAVTSKSPSHFRGDDRPVEQVSWDDVQAFLGRLEALGLPGFRLPTEVEWAWAARCGVATRWAGADRDKPVAVAGRRGAAPVGALCSSAVGALDLSGNLGEWQQDWWSDAPATGVDAKRSPPVDMQDLASTSEPESGFVHRGGGWGNFPQATRVAERDFGYPHHRDANLGVRLLRTAPIPPLRLLTTSPRAHTKAQPGGRVLQWRHASPHLRPAQHHALHGQRRGLRHRARAAGLLRGRRGPGQAHAAQQPAV